MTFARRDLLKFAGGAGAGLAFTPAPWKMLRDTATLSENWPGIPHPLKGEIRARYTTCTLCPAGCGVRARCVGDQPVSLAGVAGHPGSRGALCPAGLVGHHLTFHPRRAGQMRGDALPAIAAAIDACGPRESVAFLDPRPGRAASLVYRRYVESVANGIYCVAPGAEPYGPFGIDLENTRAIVSFGEPVLDGWLSPGRVCGNRNHFQLIQVEAAYSRTASLADLWIPMRPGEEASAAADLAGALQGEAADGRIAQAARMLLDNRPAIAIGAGPHIARLNSILGSVGRPGGFLRRRTIAPPAAEFASLPDHSIRVLLIEEAAGAAPLAWEMLQCKLVEGHATVVALTPWQDGYAAHADYVIPAPMYLESLDEAPTAEGSPVATFSLSPPLLAALPKRMIPADFILRLAHESTTYADVLKQRVAAIKKDGHGSVFSYSDGKSTRVSGMASAEDLWKALMAGAIWQDDPIRNAPANLPPHRLEGNPPPAISAEFPLTLVAADSPPRSSPLMSKLYRESGLRICANQATVHPETGKRYGLEGGSRASIRTASGTLTVQVLLDPAAMPGTIEMTAATGPKFTPANIRRI